MRFFVPPYRPIALLALMVLAPLIASGVALGQTAFPGPQWQGPLIRPLPELVLPAPDWEVPDSVRTSPETIPPGVVADHDEVIVVETDEPLPKIWDRSFEMGLAGAEGSSRAFNFRIGGDLKREVDGQTTTFRFDYKKNTANGISTVNRLFTEGRHVWSFEASPWTSHLHGSTEFDDFQAFDSRIAGNGGVGYQFWDTGVGKLKGRVGAGGSREVGGPEDRFVPEANIGMEFEHQLTKKQKLSASGDIFPSWEDFSAYRLTLRADWEIILDQETNLSLKVGVIDRYDSTSNGAEPNQLDYSTVLLWSF